MTHTVDRGYPWQLSGAQGWSVERVRAHATHWVRRFQRYVTLTDAAVVIAATASTHTLWFGFTRVEVSTSADFGVDYVTFSVALMVAWMLALVAAGSRDSRILGTDATEYRRIINATLALFGTIAVIGAMTQTDFARGYLVTAFPLGTILLLLSRWMWRRWLHARRRRGEFSFRVLLVGNAQAVRELIDSLALRTDAGYRVVAAVITDDPTRAVLDDVPVYAAADDFSNTLAAASPDTVIVVGSDASASRINELSWRLDPGQQLVVAPQLVGVAGSRIHTRPVSGLPLIHVETPSYDGPKRFAKRAFDLVFGGGLVLALLPVFVVTAVLVKATSRGPVFYGQERIGLSGEPFTMLKFRSMVTDADAHLAELLAAQGTGDTPLFKVRDDPRVTSVGRVLRRYSVDELPQLLNVIRGDMSLVGPRPQRDGEVRLYDSKAGRRLVVKPGMSGLWQVSGRSNLSWEDSIRLDLYYVENWSITNDIIILLRTARAVVGADGAY
ncbi:MAG TPA: sugar transferase [Pseudolysinimonas sp.]|nr:sugar transferase [Pseudolysinimonas sp.]